MDSQRFPREVIRSKDNPSVKLFRKLVNSKKERYENRLFALEGARLIFDALKENVIFEKILITETAASGSIGERLSEFDNCDVLIISDELGAKCSDTEKPQGIFAVCGMPKSRSIDLIKKGGRYIALHRLQDPGNVGMIIRTADALGMDGVILCESCDVYSPKTVRATMGSLFRVPAFIGSAYDVFSKADEVQLETFAAIVDESAADIKSISFEGGGIIFIGNEGRGLTDEISEMCGKRVTIKMKGNTESLNAAMAAGIMMWEMS